MMPQEAVKWATAPGLAVGDVLHAWHSDHLVDVPIGPTFDVLRVIAPVGWAALAIMRAEGHHFGPVVEVLSHPMLEVVIPPAAAADWPLIDHTVCVAVNQGRLRCPPPTITARSIPVDERVWAFAPSAIAYTDAEALHEAVATARDRYRRRHVPDDPDEERERYHGARRLTLASQ
ncbi:hypothetical protein GCM10009753_66120 [Streptantibioticus ferralitis]